MVHPNYDEWWQKRNARIGCKNIQPAMLIVGGLFDAEDCFEVELILLFWLRKAKKVKKFKFFVKKFDYLTKKSEYKIPFLY
jgi:hypothetical protein